MSAARQRVHGLTRELRAAWEETTVFWNDAKSREFQKRYLDELFIGVDRVLAEIETLERILSKIHSDCE